MSETTKKPGESYGTHFPGSIKVYQDESSSGVRVPFRSIELEATRTAQGDIHKNPSVWVYDPSGPWTDPDVELDVRSGLPRLRDSWIRGRDDTEEYGERGFRSGDDGVRGDGLR